MYIPPSTKGNILIPNIVLNLLNGNYTAYNILTSKRENRSSWPLPVDHELVAIYQTFLNGACSMEELYRIRWELFEQNISRSSLDTLVLKFRELCREWCATKAQKGGRNHGHLTAAMLQGR